MNEPEVLTPFPSLQFVCSLISSSLSSSSPSFSCLKIYKKKNTPEAQRICYAVKMVGFKVYGRHGHTNESNNYQLLLSSSKKEYNYTLLKLPVIQVAV